MISCIDANFFCSEGFEFTMKGNGTSGDCVFASDDRGLLPNRSTGLAVQLHATVAVDDNAFGYGRASFVGSGSLEYTTLQIDEQIIWTQPMSCLSWTYTTTRAM